MATDPPRCSDICAPTAAPRASVSVMDTRGHRSPEVQRHLRSYRRSARNRRHDMMEETLAEVHRLAPKLGARERRRLYKSMLASKSTFKVKPAIELIPTYDARMKAQNAKKRWEEADVFVCQKCALEETKDASQFPKIIPCGHRSLCMNCAPREKECPSCKGSIDHKLTTYLRPTREIARAHGKIMMDVKASRCKTHAANLGLLRRATLARVRDVRKQGAGQDNGIKTEAIPGDRTAKILAELGKRIGVSSTEGIKKLQHEFEQTVQLASSNDTFRAGSKKLAKLFSTLALNPHQEDIPSNSNATAMATTTPPTDDFALQEGDSRFQLPAPPLGVHAELLWGYDTSVPLDITPTNMLFKYLSNDPKIRMARFKARMIPEVKCLESTHRDAELAHRMYDNAMFTERCHQKRELLDMLNEDHALSRKRLLDMQLAKSGTPDHDFQNNLIQQDLLEEHFAAQKKEHAKTYPDGDWEMEQDRADLAKRSERMKHFALQMKVLEIYTDLICFNAMLESRHSSVERALNDSLKSCSTGVSFVVKTASKKAMTALSHLLARRCALYPEIGVAIDIEHSNLTDPDFMESVLSCPGLHALIIQNCTTIDAFLPASLTRLPTALTDLCLSRLGLRLNAQEENRLALLSALSSLKNLDLSHNNLEANTGTALADILYGGGLQQVELLDVSWNSLGATGCGAMLEALRKRQAQRGMTLNISYNCWRLGDINLKVPGSLIIADSRQPGNVYAVEMRYPIARARTPALRKKKPPKAKNKETKKKMKGRRR